MKYTGMLNEVRLNAKVRVTEYESTLITETTINIENVIICIYVYCN